MGKPPKLDCDTGSAWEQWSCSKLCDDPMAHGLSIICLMDAKFRDGISDCAFQLWHGCTWRTRACKLPQPKRELDRICCCVTPANTLSCDCRECQTCPCPVPGAQCHSSTPGWHFRAIKSPLHSQKDAPALQGWELLQGNRDWSSSPLKFGLQKAEEFTHTVLFSCPVTLLLHQNGGFQQSVHPLHGWWRFPAVIPSSQ